MIRYIVRDHNFFKQKTAYEILIGLVGSEMCIRDSCVIEALSDSQFRWESAGAVASAKARQRKADAGAPIRWQLRLSAHLAGLLQRPFSG